MFFYKIVARNLSFIYQRRRLLVEAVAKTLGAVGFMLLESPIPIRLPIDSRLVSLYPRLYRKTRGHMKKKKTNMLQGMPDLPRLRALRHAVELILRDA